MNKLRTDSVYSQLTPEQVEMLEGWLFEENLGYKEALERVEKEFKVKGSLSGLRRFYRRLAMERSREDLVEMASVCADALATAKTDGTLQAGLLTLGYKCAMELLVQSPEKVREFTALLRALTSAQALEMKRMEFQRGEDERKAQALKKQKDEEWEREWRRKLNEEKEARWKAREEKRKAKMAAEEATKVKDATPQPGNELTATLDQRESATSPRPSPPEAEREKDGESGDAVLDSGSATPGPDEAPRVAA